MTSPLFTERDFYLESLLQRWVSFKFHTTQARHFLLIQDVPFSVEASWQDSDLEQLLIRNPGIVYALYGLKIWRISQESHTLLEIQSLSHHESDPTKMEALLYSAKVLRTSKTKAILVSIYNSQAEAASVLNSTQSISQPHSYCVANHRWNGSECASLHSSLMSQSNSTSYFQLPNLIHAPFTTTFWVYFEGASSGRSHLLSFHNQYNSTLSVTIHDGMKL